MNLAERKAERAKQVVRMRAINDLAEKEKRSFNPEEDAEYRKLEAEVDKVADEIDAEEKRIARVAKLKGLEGDLDKVPDPKTKPTPGNDPTIRADPRTAFLSSDEYRSAFAGYLRGDMDLSQVRAAMEKRADTLQVGLFTKGGALVMPQQMMDGLIKAVDDQTFMLQICNVERLTAADSLGVLSLDADPDDADWTTELKTGSQTDITLGKREMRPHPMAKRVKVSNTLLRKTAGGAETLVNSRLSYKFGVTFEKAGLTGDGVRKPLGVFTASNDGIPTSRDISTDNTTTDITADGLIEAKHFIKAAYWPSLRWIFHRDAIKRIRKLKDGNGQYLWMPGLSGGLPDRILEVPYSVSEFAPNTFTTGQYVGIIGDFRNYTIALALTMEVQRLVELYAEANQTGFLARMEADGAPLLSEAFARVKLA